MGSQEFRAFEKRDLDQLIGALMQAGFVVVGPTVREGAIVYEEIEGAHQLPLGIRDRQSPGCYRLERGQVDRYFDYTAGPGSWKRYVHPPRKRLFEIDNKTLQITVPEPPPPLAFLGVRACELAALRVLEQAVPSGQRPFIVAVECARAGALCFCVSMQTGPQVKAGFDLLLVELKETFLARAGSERGALILAAVPTRTAWAEEVEWAEQQVLNTAQSMGRELDAAGVRELLLGNLDHPQWDDVASRCLGCANCTMVCPTCFCSTVEDHTDLNGQMAERVELWDSCFNLDFTFTNGQPARRSVRSRYRQWLTHKLASWWDQFGTSGCVGCGRCIAWCPVGIDLTQEVAAIQGQRSP